jgi:hypothetical protein
MSTHSIVNSARKKGVELYHQDRRDGCHPEILAHVEPPQLGKSHTWDALVWEGYVAEAAAQATVPSKQPVTPSPSAQRDSISCLRRLVRAVCHNPAAVSPHDIEVRRALYAIASADLRDGTLAAAAAQAEAQPDVPQATPPPQHNATQAAFAGPKHRPQVVDDTNGGEFEILTVGTVLKEGDEYRDLKDTEWHQTGDVGKYLDRATLDLLIYRRRVKKLWAGWWVGLRPHLKQFAPAIEAALPGIRLEFTNGGVVLAIGSPSLPEDELAKKRDAIKREIRLAILRGVNREIRLAILRGE